MQLPYSTKKGYIATFDQSSSTAMDFFKIRYSLFNAGVLYYIPFFVLYLSFHNIDGRS